MKNRRDLMAKIIEREMRKIDVPEIVLRITSRPRKIGTRIATATRHFRRKPFAS